MMRRFRSTNTELETIREVTATDNPSNIEDEKMRLVVIKK